MLGSYFTPKSNKKKKKKKKKEGKNTKYIFCKIIYKRIILIIIISIHLLNYIKKK